MAVEQLNSNDIGIFISTNTVTPALKEIVCGENIRISFAMDVKKKNTKCGVLKSTSVPDYSMDFTGAANTTPTSGSEISAQELATIADAGDAIYVVVKHRADPTKYYRQGIGYLSKYDEDIPEGDLVSFSGTIDITGAIDLTS